MTAYITLQPGYARSRRGSVMVETLLVVPVLLMLIFGIVEIGYYIFIQHTVKSAAQAAVRSVIVADNTSMTPAQDAAARVMNSVGISSGQYSLTVTPDPSAAASGSLVTAEVDCTWGTVGVRAWGFIPASRQVRGTAVMVKE